MPKNSLFRFNLIFICIFLLLWLTGISSLVLFKDISFFNSLIPFSQLTFSKVCHQNLDKTIIINDAPLLVCSRCFGIYAGGFIASFLIIIFYNKIFPVKFPWLLIALILILADVIMHNVGLYEYSKPIAFTTGFILGSIFISYITFQIKNYFAL